GRLSSGSARRRPGHSGIEVGSTVGTHPPSAVANLSARLGTLAGPPRQLQHQPTPARPPEDAERLIQNPTPSSPSPAFVRRRPRRPPSSSFPVRPSVRPSVR